MNGQSIVASSLPSLIIPCPHCLGRMVFSTIRTTKTERDVQDMVYACQQCGTELLRTTYRTVNPVRAA